MESRNESERQFFTVIWVFLYMFMQTAILMDYKKWHDFVAMCFDMAFSA